MQISKMYFKGTLFDLEIEGQCVSVEHVQGRWEGMGHSGGWGANSKGVYLLLRALFFIIILNSFQFIT